MGFCDREKQLMTEGVTCIDNRFILNYVPDAHGKCVAVYLLGLALADSDGTDNSCEAMAAKLELSPEEVMAAYRYSGAHNLRQSAQGDLPQRARGGGRAEKGQAL